MAKKGGKGGKKSQDIIFEDIDIDDLDLGVDDIMFPSSSDDREPIVKIKESFVESTKDTLKSPSFYKGIMREALPKEYKEALDHLDYATDQGAQLYNRSASKLAPTIREIKKKSRNVLPFTENYLPKKVQDKLKMLLETDELDYSRQTEEQRRDDTISMEMGKIFNTQLQENARMHEEDKKLREIDEGVSNAQHLQTLKLLSGIREAGSRLVGYQDSIAVNWQRKMLEVSYRQLYSSRDQLQQLKTGNTELLGVLQAIVKNTGLPDSNKLQNVEAFGQAARERFITKVQDKLTPGLKGLTDRVMTNLRTKLDGALDGFRDNVDLVSSIGGMAEGMDGASLAGNVASNVATDSAGGLIGRTLGKLGLKSNTVRASAARLGTLMDNGVSSVNNFAGSRETDDDYELDQESGEYRRKGGFARFFRSNLKDLLRQNGDPDIIAGDLTDSAEDAVVFNAQTRRSINEIIPGFLSRILREVSIIRTGDETTSLVTYNLSRGMFSSTREKSDDIKRRLIEKGGKDSTRNDLDRIASTIDPTGQLSPSARKALERQLIHNARETKGFRVDNLANAAQYKENISQQDKDELAAFFRTQFKTDETRRLGESPELDEKIRKASGQFQSLSRNVPNLINEIETQLSVGNRDTLEELGFLKRDKGVSRLDFDAIVRMLTGNEEGLQSENNSTASNANTQAPLYHFSNAGYHSSASPFGNQGSAQTGGGNNPTSAAIATALENAQNQTAPNTSTSPVSNTTPPTTPSANSNFFANMQQSFQAAIEEARGLFGPRAVDGAAAPQADTNTPRYADEEYSRFETNVLKLLEDSLETERASAILLQQLLENGITLAGEGSPDGRRFGLRYGIRSGLGKLMSGAGGLAGYAMKGYGKMFSGTAGLIKGGLNLAGGGLSLGGKLLGGLVGGVSDIYVRGEQQPVLFAKALKKGLYRDQETGKVIKKLKDIKGPVIDEEGNVVISAEDITKGLYDIQGKPILKDVLRRGINFYGKLLSPFTLMASIATGSIKGVYNVLTKPKDIYVRGEPAPRLLAKVLLSGGYRSERTGSTLRSIKDIDGPVVDRNGNIILSMEDLKTGLVDRNGKTIRTLSEKAVDAAMGIGKFGVNVLKKTLALGMLPYKAAGWLAKKGSRFVKRGLGVAEKGGSPEEATAYASAETNDILSNILRVLEDRLPGRKKFGDTDGDGIREGSYQDIMRRRKEKGDKQAEAGKEKGDSKGLFAGLGASLKALFGKGEGEEESEEEGDTYIGMGGDGGGDDEDGKKKKGKNKKPKGRFGRAMSKMGGWAKKIPGAGMLGRLGGMGLNVARAGLMFAGGSALAGMGGSLLTGAGAILGGIGAVLASPVVLTALAVAAVGTAGYFAYKYFSGGYNTDIRDIRLLQYGVNPTEEDKAKKVLYLEDAVKDLVSINGKDASIKFTDEKLKDVMEGFGVNLESEEEVVRWIEWFDKRFKPIYLTHRSAANAVVIDATLKDTDADFKPEQKLDFLKRVKMDAGNPMGPYNVNTSPFGVKDSLSVNNRSIEDAFVAAEAKFTEEVKKGGGTTPAADAAKTESMKAALTAAAAQPLNAPLTSYSSPGATKTLGSVNQLTATSIGMRGGLGVSGSVTSTGTFQSVTNNRAALTTLDCIRFKTYGLYELDIDKVRALQDLEARVMKVVTYDARGRASFSDSPEPYIKEFAAVFGFSTSDSYAVADWTVWFNSRFIPTLVTYYTAVKTLVEAADIQDAIRFLKPDQMLQVAMAIVAATSGSGIFNNSVWTVTQSPWPNYQLNTNAESVQGNLDKLKTDVKQRTLDDSVAPAGKVTQGPVVAAPTPTQSAPAASAPTAVARPSVYTVETSSEIVNKQQASQAEPLRAYESNDDRSGPKPDYIMPVDGRISSPFGMRVHPITGATKEHKGIDIAAPQGTPVKAAAAGTITQRMFSKSYGNVIYISHPDGSETRYAHLNHFQPGYSVGSEVAQGAVIGYVGNTGASAGNHLHFEIRAGKGNSAKAIDPLSAINRTSAKPAVAELKSEVKTLQTDKAESVEDTIEGQDTVASTVTGKTAKDQPQNALMPPAKEPTTGIMALAPQTDLNSAVTMQQPVRPAMQDDGVVEKQRAEQQRRAMASELRDRSTSTDVNSAITTMNKFLEQSLGIQRSMDDKLAGIGSTLSAIEKNTQNTGFLEKGAKAVAEAKTPTVGKRPIETQIKPNPVSLSKTR